MSARRGLTGLLVELKRSFPESFTATIQTGGKGQIGFDALGCRVDALEVVDCAAKCRAGDGSLRLAEVQALLERTRGELLPMLEEMEERVTRGRGVGGEVVRAARERVTRGRGGGH